MDKDKISRKYAINQIEMGILYAESISDKETKEHFKKVKDFILALPCIEELDEYVYCIDCENFVVKDTNSDIKINCKFADKCWFFNPENSTPRHKRLCWSPNTKN